MNAVVLVSNRHAHLNREAVDLLFGQGYELTVKKALDNPIFAANETVTIEGPKGKIENVRILGPLRPYNQIEILKSDSFTLGTDAPVKMSGSDGLAPLTVIGPKGKMEVDSIAVIAKRHIHINTDDAAEYGLENKQKVSVKVGGERGLVFNETVISYTEIDKPTLHIDIEEANAADLSPMEIVEVII